MKVNNKFAIGGIIAFILIVFIGVGSLLFQGYKSASYTITSDSLQISGMYGETVKAADIKNISISEDLPEIKKRTNGSAIGSQLKGHFDVTGYGNATLFLDTKIPPFIFIETGTKIIILNDTDRTKTETLYKNIKALAGK